MHPFCLPGHVYPNVCTSWPGVRVEFSTLIRSGDLSRSWDKPMLKVLLKVSSAHSGILNLKKTGPRSWSTAACLTVSRRLRVPDIPHQYVLGRPILMSTTEWYHTCGWNIRCGYPSHPHQSGDVQTPDNPSGDTAMVFCAAVVFYSDIRIG